MKPPNARSCWRPRTGTCDVFEFYDGRDPDHMTVSTVARRGLVYQRSLRQLMALRGALLKPQ